MIFILMNTQQRLNKSLLINDFIASKKFFEFSFVLLSKFSFGKKKLTAGHGCITGVRDVSLMYLEHSMCSTKIEG